MVFAQRSATSCFPVSSDLGVKNQNPVLSETFRKVSEMCFGFGLESFHLCLMLLLARKNEKKMTPDSDSK